MQMLFCNSDLGTCCASPALAIIMNAIRHIIELIQTIVPILLILAACIQLSKMVMNPEEKNKYIKIKNMFIAAIIVFFIPVFVNVIMGLLPGNLNVTSCWKNSQKLSETAGTTMPSYLDPNEISNKKSNILIDPDDYQKGKNNSNDSSTPGGNTLNPPSINNTQNKKATVSGADVIAYARQFIGQRYVRGGYWNGEKPYTPTDCVGFVKGVYKHFGINIPSNTSSLYNSKKFTVVTGQPVKAGDIVIYAHHRALITGNKKQVVHAMGEAYGIGQSKNYKSCGAGDVIAVVRVNKVY